jgi:putative ABC transport system permease protein
VFALVRVNLSRRLGRSALSALGVALGVTTVVALLALTNGLNRSAGALAHLGRADFGVFQGGLSDLTASSLPDGVVGRIAKLPGVAGAAGVLILSGAVEKEPETLVFGAEPTGFLAKRLVLVAGHGLSEGAVIAGIGAARVLNLHVGQEVAIDGVPLPVVGIYSSGIPLEDGGLVIPLPLARRLSGRTETISMVAVSILPGYREATVRAEVERALPGTVALGAPGELSRVDTNSRTLHEAALIVAVLALALGAVMVLNTVALAVLERRHELAILSTLGWTRLQICNLLAGESLLLSVGGAAVGLALGVVAAEAAVHGLAIATFVPARLTVAVFLEGAAVGLALGVLGALFAAWQVLRLPLKGGLGP